MDERERFVAAIRNWLAQENMSVRAAAMRSGIPVRSFQGIMDGQQPSIGRAAEICEALDIDFRIGPLRPESGGVRPPPATLEAEQRPAWADDLFEKVEGLRLEMDRTSRTRSDIVTTGGDVETRHIEVVEVGAAVGDGQDEGLETVTGRVPFRSDWLKRHRLDPEQCRVIGVIGESMEPVLPEGCSILVDMRARRLRAGRIFVVRGEDGITVKRAVREGKKWMLESEHPAREPIPWPRGAEVIGEVRWMARTL